MKSFLVTIQDGEIRLPSSLPEGTKVSVHVEVAKSAAQVRGWHRIVKAVAGWANRNPEPVPLPTHESVVEVKLRTAFLGIQESALEPKHISSASKRQMSEGLSRLEVWCSEQGIDISHDERNFA